MLYVDVTICYFLQCYNVSSINIVFFQVKILNHDNLLVIKKRGSVLEDTDAVLQKISSITKYNIKSLSAAVIVSDDPPVAAADDDDSTDRQLAKSTKYLNSSVLQLVIYGLNSQEEPIDYSDIKA
jgi:hypothetical protein